MRGSNAATKTVPLVGITSPAAIIAIARAGASPLQASASFSPSFSARVTGGADVPPRTYAAARSSSSAIDLDALQARIRAFGTPGLMTRSPRTVLVQSDDIGRIVVRPGTREECAADRVSVDRNARGFERADALGGESAAGDDSYMRVSGGVKCAADVEDQFGDDARRFERAHHLPQGAIDERSGRIQPNAPQTFAQRVRDGKARAHAVVVEIDQRDHVDLRVGILRELLRRQYRVAAVSGDERMRNGAHAARTPPLRVCIRRNAQRTGDVCGVAVPGLHQMMIEACGKEEHLLARGSVDDGARIGGDSRAPAEHAQVTGFQMREQRVVAFNRHYSLVGRSAVAVAQRAYGQGVPSVFPRSPVPPARTEPQNRDRLVDTADDRVAALKDLHAHDRPPSVAFQNVPRAVEIRIRVVAVAHLLDGQIEDSGRQSRLHLPRAFAGRTGGSPFRHERRRAVCYSSGVTNTEIAGILMRMRTLMELSGESFYKFMAYERAAAALENAAPVHDLIAAGELKSLPGIGKTLSAIIEEIARTGTCEPFETLQQRYPASIFEILGVSGIGIKTAAMLFDQ